MAARYINPGYGAWLNDSAVSTIENNFIYNPEHGISFEKQNSHREANRIPLAQAFTTDISAKFNMYIGSAFPSAFFIGAKSNIEDTDNLTYKCFGFSFDSYTLYLLAGAATGTTGGKIIQLSTESLIKKNSLNTIHFHIHRGEDAASSFGEIIINGTTTSKQFTSDNYRYNFSDEEAFFIHFPTNSGTYISELIVSNDTISPKEKIIALPTNATATDMTAGQDGIYIADAANQSLLQTPDVASLIESYGISSTVTGVAIAGNPAYRTETGITTLTGLSKSGNVITEHNCLALSDDTIATIQDGWTISNATIADLANMQFGWRAGE